MPKLLQKALLAIGVVAFLALAVEIGLSIAATMHGSTPVRVVAVDGGSYLWPADLPFLAEGEEGGKETGRKNC